MCKTFEEAFHDYCQTKPNSPERAEALKVALDSAEIFSDCFQVASMDGGHEITISAIKKSIPLVKSNNQISKLRTNFYGYINGDEEIEKLINEKWNQTTNERCFEDDIDDFWELEKEYADKKSDCINTLQSALDRGKTFADYIQVASIRFCLFVTRLALLMAIPLAENESQLDEIESDYDEYLHQDLLQAISNKRADLQN